MVRRSESISSSRSPLAVVAGSLLGALIELALLRPLRGADIDTTMLVMIGAWIVMQNTELLVWGGVAKSIVDAVPGGAAGARARSRSPGCGSSCSPPRCMLIVGTYLLIHRTKLGKAMRATFQDRDTAALMGVNIERHLHRDLRHRLRPCRRGRRAAGAGLRGLPTMGDLAALKAFAIVILGGLGNITGATIGGFILALAEELGAGYVSSGYRDAMGFLIIIAVLLFKPTGLFARAERVG